jgi:pimeloyl-ACP methyl ester carboxylesterase
MFVRTKENYNISLKFYNKSKEFTILYCHSVTETFKSACEWVEKVILPLDLVNVLVFDYYASQENNENVNESCIYTDCEAVLWFITDCLRLQKRKLILFGKCIGAGIALYLAERYPDIAGLIMQSSLTYSLRVSYKFKISFPRDFYPSPEVVKKVQCPVLFIHGLHDNVTGFRYIKDFHESLKNHRKKIVSVEGGHECDGDEVVKAVKEFLEKGYT